MFDNDDDDDDSFGERQKDLFKESWNEKVNDMKNSDTDNPIGDFVTQQAGNFLDSIGKIASGISSGDMDKVGEGVGEIAADAIRDKFLKNLGGKSGKK